MDDFVLESEGAGLEPSVEITEDGPCSRTLTITVPASTVDERLETSLGTITAEANIPGFRKGRVPRSIVEKRFGGHIRQEARGQLMSDAFTKAIESSKLDILGEPSFDESKSDSEILSGKDLTFTVTVEIAPEFDLPDLEGVPVIKPIMEINDEHVDAEVLRARYRFGTPEKIEGPFENLDRLMGHVEVRLNGSDDIFFESDKAVSVIPGDEDEGKGQFLGLMVDNLEKTLLGKKIGETVEFETVGPESHEQEELRGAKIAIKYDIRDAERVTPLEITDLLSKLALDNETGLREQILSSLERRRDSEQRAAEREQVYEWLLENIEFEAPPRMTENQVGRLIESQRMELASRGHDDDEIETQLATTRMASESSTQNRIRLFFILGSIARHFEINVTEEEINGRIAELALSRGVRPEQARAELAKAYRIQEIALQIREHKAADRIVDTAKVTEMPADDWNALVDKRAAEKAGRSTEEGDSDEKPKKKTKKKTTKKKSS